MANVGRATQGKVLTARGPLLNSGFQEIGTNSALTDHGVLIAQGNDPFVAISPGSAGQVLVSNGAAADPTFQGGGSTFATTYEANDATTATPSGAVLKVYGGTKAAGTSPVASIASGNTVTTQVQISQAIVGADATKIGLAAFDSAKLTVDATGFVSVPTATESVLGVVELATQAESENGTYGTTQVLQSGNIDSMFATPAPIGSGTRNTALFTTLGSNAGQTFSVGTDTFPSSTTTITSTAYTSNNQVAQFNINGAVPASISAGFGASLQLQAQNTAGTQVPFGLFTALWDVATAGSEVSHINLYVRSGGASQIAFQAYADHVVMPKGQYVNVTTPGAYPYTTLISDYLILVDTSSARTITPLASPATGATYVIKDNVGSAAANNITITPSGKNIDGSASYVINVNYGSVTIIYNGVQWNIV